MFDNHDLQPDLVDLDNAVRRYAQMNPHVAISEIAFLMGASQDAEPGEFDLIPARENV